MENIETNKEIDGMLSFAIKEQYKELCDKIKSQILKKLLEVCILKKKDKQYLTMYELAYIQGELDKLLWRYS